MHQFISYSGVDGVDFALLLATALEAGPNPIRVWLDRRDLRPGPEDWDTQIDRAICECEGLIFVMTGDSVADTSVCKSEWTRALKFKKPVIPVRLHADAELPFRLDSRQFVDFSSYFEAGLEKLRRHLVWIATPEGQLRCLKHRLGDAYRDLRRASVTDCPRIEKEIRELEEEISRMEKVVKDLKGAANEAETSIQTRIDGERRPAKPLGPESRTKFINPPPRVPPYFQDRHVEMKLITDFLNDESLRVMSIYGRGGVGKTAMVCRLLRALEHGHLPDDLGPRDVDGIVYLSQIGSHRVSLPTLYGDLCRLLPLRTAQRLNKLYRDPKTSARDKMFALLEAFRGQPVVVLLDNLEHLMDPEKRILTDLELQEALCALLEAPHHTVKILITTRLAPQNLLMVQPQRQRVLALNEGLDSPYAENILRALDTDGTVGLKTAPDAVLEQIRVRTRGFPRALEALYMSLAADRSTTLDELLACAEHALPEKVVETLVGEAFSRLDRSCQMVMQALAIYARPVPPVAVDYLLQPFLQPPDSVPVLNRLVNMCFVRKEKGRYYLHPLDLDYALGRIPPGGKGDGGQSSAPFTQYAMRHRAAEYFALVRLDRSEWKTLPDLEPQLAEYEQRYASQDYDTAARLLDDIDYSYLGLWGHSRLIANLRQRLLGRLGDKGLEEANRFRLGVACWNVGESRRGIEYYREALAIAREIDDQGGAGRCLGGLGTAHWDLGEVEEARKYYEESLGIARKLGSVAEEGIRLGNLGLTYRDLGQTHKAIEHYQEALTIAVEINDRRNAGVWLENLGVAHCDLGEMDKAMMYSQEALKIACQIVDRRHESLRRSYIGNIWIALGQQAKAEAELLEASRIAEEIGHAECRAEAQMTLAVTCLLGGKLESALAAARGARETKYARYLPTILALQGTIALRLNDNVDARSLFAEAVCEAEVFLKRTPQLYTALQVKGLALCGLSLCQEPCHLPTAEQTYRAARAVTRAPGIVQRALQLFDALAVADEARILAPVRPVVEGQA